MRNPKIAKHIFIGLGVMTVTLWQGYTHFFTENLLLQNQAMASELKKVVKPLAKPADPFVTKQQARDIIHVTAALIKETENYPNINAIQEDAYRVLGTSFINKKAFEKQPNFQALITEKKYDKKEKRFTCQYSWYCEAGSSQNLDMKYLRGHYKERFDIAFKMASEIVLGGFVRYAYSETVPFDGAFYCTTESYRSPKSWHRGEVEAGRMCRGRTIDGHVHIAPRAAGTTCKQNQLAYYGK